MRDRYVKQKSHEVGVVYRIITGIEVARYDISSFPFWYQPSLFN